MHNEDNKVIQPSFSLSFYRWIGWLIIPSSATDFSGQIVKRGRFSYILEGQT